MALVSNFTDQNQTQKKLEINTSPTPRAPTVTALSQKARALRLKGIQGKFFLNGRYTALILMRYKSKAR